MNTRAILCAEYVLRLSQALAEIRYAADRPMYQAYLADAAVLLALITRDDASPEIDARIALHERLCSQTFPSGPEQAAVAEAWQRFLRPL